MGAALSNIAVGGENADRSELAKKGDDLSNERESPFSENSTVLLGNLERLWSTRGSPTLHAIAWNDEMKGLVLLIKVGDCVFPYILHQGDIADDPVATADNLIARGKCSLAQPDADEHLITFKR